MLTSLRESKNFPAQEVVELYHERWELELGYDEIKTDLLDREETIRSKTPDAVRQELWGVLLVFNLVRLETENQELRTTAIDALELAEVLFGSEVPYAVRRCLRDLRRHR